MSSHHIVRDQQEPAVLIDKMQSFPVEILHTLLEWSPVVLCCEQSIDFYTQQGLKLDVGLVSHNKHEYWKNELKMQHPVKIVAVPNMEFLMAALTLLKKDNHKSINIVSDQESLFVTIDACQQWVPELDVVILTESHRHVLQRHKTYKKWLSAATSISVTGLEKAVKFSTTGFDADLKGDVVTEEQLLVKSNEGEATIACSSVPFLISEKW